MTIPTLQSVRAQRDNVLRLAEQYGVYNVRVFGSVARGDARRDSDIDLLVSVRPGVSMFDLVGLWQDLEALFGRSVSLVTEDDDPRHERFMRQVLKDAVSL